MPALSIIVTSYNIEDYLADCLDTVVGQTLDDLEIIVVDDGSTDSSPQIIEKYAAADPRIVPVLLATNSVGGVATAANAGLDRATGEYVGFADGDDLYEPDMFEQLLDAARTHDADLAICRYMEFDSRSGERREPADTGRWVGLEPGLQRLDVETTKRFLRFIAVPWRKIYRRSLIEQHHIRFPVGDYFFEDNPFHWYSLIHAETLAVVTEVLCHHRVTRAGQTMSTADERLFRIFQHHDTIFDFLDERGLGAQFRPTLLAWAVSQLEWISRRTPDELQRSLFDVVTPIVARYDDATIRRALTEGKKGERARLLTHAVRDGNFQRFAAAAGATLPPPSLPSKALRHLRTGGPVHTARVAARFARQRAARNVPAGLFTRQSKVTNDDLMFALMVLEQRIARLEEAIGRGVRDVERSERSQGDAAN